MASAQYQNGRLCLFDVRFVCEFIVIIVVRFHYSCTPGGIPLASGPQMGGPGLISRSAAGDVTVDRQIEAQYALDLKLANAGRA